MPELRDLLRQGLGDVRPDVDAYGLHIEGAVIPAHPD